MSPSSPNHRVLATVLGVLALASQTACNLPRAQLANLREVHQPDGRMSYLGNVQSDLEYALSAALSNSPVRIRGLDGLSAADEVIEDPCGIDLDSLNALAKADSKDIYYSGLQVEAFGWLGPDDQYVLGRERAVLELGKAAKRLELDGPIAPPEIAATPEEVSPVLAGLARAGLGSLTNQLADDELVVVLREDQGLIPAIEAVRALPFDRAGALRALAVCDVVFYRAEGLRNSPAADARELRALALELQTQIVGMALAECLGDPSPLVRATSYEALAGLPGGPPLGLLKLGATDPDPTVASRALLLVARRGLPLERVPVEDRVVARKGWLDFLVGQAQSPDPRTSFGACCALVEVAGTGSRSLRPEDWTMWWRAENPDMELPRPLVATAEGAGDNG